MKILILSSRFPYPIEKGDKLRLYYQLKSLSLHHEIHLISLTDIKVTTQEIDHVRSMCSSVIILPINKWISRVSVIFGVFSKLPFQIRYFYRKKYKSIVDNKINTIQPDAIYCQLIRMAEYVKHVKKPMVLDFMDAFSLSSLRRSEHGTWLEKIFFRNESSRLRKYEIKIQEHFCITSVISENDKNQLSQKGNDGRIIVISNGLDTAYFNAEKCKKKYDLLFVGNMGYHPNILAAKYLVKNILPELKNDVTVQIAGNRPAQSVKALSRQHVHITGWLDDIRDAYNNSIIFVAPVFSGAGQQNKILEAMSMSLPCITTRLVNQSIGGTDSKHLFLADTPKEYAEKIEMLRADPALRKQMGIEARKYIVKNFSWKTENKKLEELIKHCVNDQRINGKETGQN